MTPVKSVQRTITLDRGELLRVYDGEGMLLTPRSGVLWITEERCANDTFLQPGETHRLEKRGLTLVHAHRAASVVIGLPAGTVAPRRVDFAAALGTIGRRIPFPTRRLVSLGWSIRVVAIAIGRALARSAAPGNCRACHDRDGSRRVYPFPYY
jgi:hypothetical protein